MKIGICSFAHLHAVGYLSILAELGVELAAADDDRDRARRICEPHGIRVFDSYADLLGWEPDGVVVTAENARHRELTELAAGAGAYVLCEKPLALSLSDCAAMIAAGERADVGLMTAFPIRFAPAMARAAAVVRAGRLGALRAIGGRNPGSMPGSWFVRPELSGGGSVVDHTVHVADLMRWLTGAEPATVYAQANALIRPEVGVETGGLVSVGFDDGTIGTIDASWSRLPTFPTWGGVTLEIVGADGVLHADAFADTVQLFGERARWLPYGADANRGMLVEFLAAIREHRAPSPDGRDGMQATAIALAAYESIRTGAVVSTAADR